MSGTSRAQERFWRKVDRRSPDECWPWLGSLDTEGYGNVTLNRRSVKAHRLSYEWAAGPIPDGLVMDHLCHTREKEKCPGSVACLHRRCVNPQHLEPVTTRENLLRGLSFSASNAAKEVCAKGHPFDVANTYVRGTRRYCRKCNRAAVDRYQARKRRLSGGDGAQVAKPPRT